MYVSSTDSPRAPTAPSPPSPPSPPVATTGGGQPSSFTDVLRTLGHDLDAGERGMRTAIRETAGRSDLDPSELIALQVGLYRYGDAIDLASRVVEGATGAVKTVLQGGS